MVNLEKSISIQPTATAHRDAALAYYSLNEYENAAAALNSAYSLNNNIVSDRDAMIVGVRSFAELGKFEVAKNRRAGSGVNPQLPLTSRVSTADGRRTPLTGRLCALR